MKLTFPEPHIPAYTWEEYKYEIRSGTYPSCEGSFCRTFMEAFEHYVTLEEVRVYEQRGTLHFNRDNKQNICTTVNHVYSEYRKQINRVMYEFLRNNNGVIDRWPYAEQTVVGSIREFWREYNGEKKIYLPFHYLGSDFVLGQNQEIQEKAYPVFDSLTFEYSYTEDIEDVWEELKELETQKNEMKSRQGFMACVKFAIGCIPLAATVFFVLLGIISFFDGGQIATALRRSLLNLPGGLKTVMMWTVGLVAEIDLLLIKSSILFWIAMPIIGFFAGCGSLLLWDKVRMVKKSEYRQAEKEYQEKRKEFHVRRDEWSETIRSWHNAYLDFIKKQR